MPPARSTRRSNTGDVGGAGAAGSGGSSGQLTVVAFTVVQMSGVRLLTPAVVSATVIVFPATETLIVLATLPTSLTASSGDSGSGVSETVVAAASAWAQPRAITAPQAIEEQRAILRRQLPTI